MHSVQLDFLDILPKGRCLQTPGGFLVRSRRRPLVKVTRHPTYVEVGFDGYGPTEHFGFYEYYRMAKEIARLTGSSRKSLDKWGSERAWQHSV